jgi:hypothetical protein
MTRAARGVLALLAGAALGVAQPAGTAPAAAELGGYTLAAQAAPVTILVYEEVLPIPASPQAEAHVSFTRSTMTTGPSGRALSSSLWPGAAVGEGLPALVGNPDVRYPVQTVATHPAGPADAKQEPVPGSGMRAHADATRVEAVAAVASSATPALPALPLPNLPLPVPGLATVDGLNSVSRNTVSGGEAAATAVASAATVDLLGGIVKIHGLRVESTASSNGSSATTASTATIAGLTVAGQRIALDQDGVRTPTGATAIPAMPAQVTDQLARLGITIKPPTVTRKAAGAEAKGTSQGLLVSLDTKPLRQQLLGAPLDLLGRLLPPELATQLTPVLNLAPRIDLIVGNAAADATAAPGFTESPGGSPPPGPPSDPPAAGPAGSGGLGSGGGTGGDAGGGGSAPAGAGPAGGGAGATVPAASGREPPAFGGLPAQLVALGLLSSTLVAWGMRRYSALLFGAGGCDLGRASGVPDLRER